MTDQAKGLWITLFGVLAIVPDSLFVRLIDAPTLTIVFWRSLTQGTSLLLVMLLIFGRNYPRSLHDVGRTAFPFGLMITGSGIAFVASVQYTTIANTVLIIATVPVFAALASWLWLGERISKRMAWTMFFAILGVSVIAYGSIEPDSQSTLLGDALALSAAIMFAIAITCARSVRPASITPVVPIAFLIFAALLFPFVDPWAVDSSDWIFIAVHGGVFIAASSALLSYGPKFITSAEVALLILLESLLAPILGWIVVGETPGNWSLVGGSIVLVTLVVSNLIALRKTK
ncbi:MAG: DMT family transporter [Pseudomonadota bacterium]